MMAGHALGTPTDAGPSLADWIATHGPLAPAHALVIALNSCARAAALDDDRLSATVGSLATSSIRRQAGAGWIWVPEPTTAPGGRVSDTEVLERVGTVVFECLTGQAPPSGRPRPSDVQARLKALRPDLPADVAEVTAHALSARDARHVSLDGFSRDLRGLLGARPAPPLPWRRPLALISLAAVAAATIFLWTGRGSSVDKAGPHGLTERETRQLDATMELVDRAALVDEHTLAVQYLTEFARVWRTRVGPSDPRLLWQQARQAWVRQLAGDWLTAEQLLVALPASLGETLGDTHPYTRAVLLDLASVLEARGARESAARQREDAARAAATVLGTPSLAAEWAPGVPWPPHVLAHAAPNAPGLEGFRRQQDGHVAPLTSTQRWLAGLHGWRLHVRAEDTCRVEVVAGADPRRVGIALVRQVNGPWKGQVEGTTPPLDWSAPAGSTIAVSLLVDGSGDVRAHLPDGSVRETALSAPAAPPVPPHTLSFRGPRDAAGCAVVWWEIVPEPAGPGPGPQGPGGWLSPAGGDGRWTDRRAGGA